MLALCRVGGSGGMFLCVGGGRVGVFGKICGFSLCLQCFK